MGDGMRAMDAQGGARNRKIKHKLNRKQGKQNCQAIRYILDNLTLQWIGKKVL